MKKIILTTSIISTIFISVCLIYIVKYNVGNSYETVIALDFEDSFFSQYYNYKLTQPLLVERALNNFGIMEVSSKKYNDKVVLNIKCSKADCSDTYLSYIDDVVYKNMEKIWEKEKDKTLIDLENRLVNIKKSVRDRFISLIFVDKISANNDFNIEENEAEYKKLDVIISRMSKEKESYFFDLFSEKEFSEIKGSILELERERFSWDAPYKISQKKVTELHKWYYMKIIIMVLIFLNVFVLFMAKLNDRFNKVYKSK